MSENKCGERSFARRDGMRRWMSHVGLYLFFGVCTTALNLLLFLMFFRSFGWPGWLSNALAWWPSVAFAWWTNRRWVFGASSCGFLRLVRELAAFTGSRLFTGVVDVFLIWLTVDLMRWHEIAMKVSVGALVVLLNYGVSRWWVFRQKREAM